MEAVGTRLRRAIERQFGSIRKFQRELEKKAPKLRGTSRQTLYRYFNGEAEPDPGFLTAAAKVLEVREEWFRGEGEMTEEAEVRAQRARNHRLSAAKDDAGWQEFDLFAEWIQEEFPDPRVMELFTHTALLATWMRLAEAGVRPRWCLEGEDRPEWDGRGLRAIRVPPDIEESHREDYAMAIYLGQALAAPFLHLPFPGPGVLDDARFAGYVGTVCQGLQRLAEVGIDLRGASVPGGGSDAGSTTDYENTTTTNQEDENGQA